MARPPLSLGTHGEIRCYRISRKSYRAIANYRDYDGVTRRVERRDAGKTAAKNRLKEALRDRSRVTAGADITQDSKISAVAALWLRDLQESGKAYRTKQTYRESWEKTLSKAVGSLRVREVTVSAADRALRTIRDNSGTGAATHAKVVLGGILALAVKYDAAERNVIRDVSLGDGQPRKAKKKSVYVIEESAIPELREQVRSTKSFRQRDLPDMVDMLSALGCRIGELLALDWERVDFDNKTVTLEGTVVREKGVGLFVQPHTKSEAGMRTIAPPSWAMDVLARRRAESAAKWVFPSKARTLRDPDNMRGFLREAVSGTQWEGLHPHAFRHLVATRLDQAGLSAREIADYLGHEQVSMTQDVYMNRKAVGHTAGAALGGFAPEDLPQRCG